MSNKEILSKFEEIKPKYTIAYRNNNVEAVTALNTEFLEVCRTLNFIPKNKADNLKNLRLTHILGNSKIGTDTICINVSAGLNCPMNLLGNCSNCNICYAVNQNKQYFKNTVPKNLINQNIINMVVTGEIKLHTVLYELVTDIYCSYTENEIKNLKFLRFNVEGDILNNDILKVCNIIAGTLKDCFNLISCYSYTHNKSLDLSIADNIVFNCSDFKNSFYKKSCYTVMQYTAELQELAIKGDIKLCLGDCNNCSYCKDINCKVPVVFLAHGGEFKGTEGIPEDIFNYLFEIKELDNKNFLEGEIIAD